MTEENTSPEENEESNEPVVNQNPKLRWYVVQAFSGYEGRVQKTLVEHIGIHGLDEFNLWRVSFVCVYGTFSDALMCFMNIGISVLNKVVTLSENMIGRTTENTTQMHC